MKSVGRLFFAAAATVLLGASGAWAQGGPPTFAPFEIYGCSFVDGNDMSDLMPILDDFNEWADEAGVDGYSAMIAEPFFQNAQFPYDFLWLGSFADGEAMGQGFHRWVNQSGDLPAQFAEVSDCPLHMGLASATLKAPTGDGDGVEDGGRFVVQFTNCTVHAGRSRGEGANAIRQWIDYAAGKGSSASHWVMVPGPGEAADADYSFKWMTGFSSWVSLGREYEIAVNDGGLGMRTDLIGRVMSCDSPRIYNAFFAREAGQS